MLILLTVSIGIPLVICAVLFAFTLERDRILCVLAFLTCWFFCAIFAVVFRRGESDAWGWSSMAKFLLFGWGSAVLCSVLWSSWNLVRWRTKGGEYAGAGVLGLVVLFLWFIGIVSQLRFVPQMR
jgi:hypothetical protein